MKANDILPHRKKLKNCTLAWIIEVPLTTDAGTASDLMKFLAKDYLKLTESRVVCRNVHGGQGHRRTPRCGNYFITNCKYYFCCQGSFSSRVG